jgi:hypothetical protein
MNVTSNYFATLRYLLSKMNCNETDIEMKLRMHKSWGTLDYLSVYQLLKEDFAFQT